MFIAVKLTFKIVIIFLLAWAGEALSASASVNSPTESENAPFPIPIEWFRYLQFTSKGPKKSLLTSKHFYRHPDGQRNPRLEWLQSVRDLQNSNLLLDSETGPMPIQCAFPARKKLLERLTGLKFPNPACPELERWQKSLGGNRIWIIYAGAYRNNPASLFGHTFLRFDKFIDGDPSRNLRSQSVGFLADTPPTDGQTETVFKGLLGFYQGYYNVQPYYMQTALYNNSESRSLWEFELNLTDAEKEWAVLYLWELSERGSMAYWFFDENCSFQLLAFLEAVRPSVELTKKSGIFVLPLETVRLLQEEGLVLNQYPVYKPSIRSRLRDKLQKLTTQQRKMYRSARTDNRLIQNLDDIDVLDALTEYQTFLNYQKKAQLTPHQRDTFEKTFLRRAQLGARSETEEVKADPLPPLVSHKPSYWQGQIGKDLIGLKGLMGVHDWSSSLKGLEDASTLEYLSANFEWSTKSSEWHEMQLLFARARTLNDWSFEEPQFSWTVDGYYEERRDNGTWLRGVNTGGAGGLAWTSQDRSWAGGFFIQARIEPHEFLDPYALGWGPLALVRFENQRVVIASESSWLIWGSERQVRHRMEVFGTKREVGTFNPLLQWDLTHTESNGQSHSTNKVRNENVLRAGLRSYF